MANSGWRAASGLLSVAVILLATNGCGSAAFNGDTNRRSAAGNKQKAELLGSPIFGPTTDGSNPSTVPGESIPGTTIDPSKFPGTTVDPSKFPPGTTIDPSKFPPGTEIPPGKGVPPGTTIPPGKIPPGKIPPGIPPGTEIPGRQTCNIFVHLHSHRPEWGAVFIPAAPIKSGVFEDDIVKRFAGRWQRGCQWPGTGVCNNGGIAYRTAIGPQPGSPECPAVFSKNYSPLIFKFSPPDEKIYLSTPQEGVRFDLLGSGGDPLLVSWPKKAANKKELDVAFLVYDKGDDGKIEDIHEMFGDNTIGPDGQPALKNGFAALAKHDTYPVGAPDRFIDRNDAIWSSLYLWFDHNRDGKSDRSELETLDQRGIYRIDLDYVDEIDNVDYIGNRTEQRSVADRVDGSMVPVLDLWFVPGVE